MVKVLVHEKSNNVCVATADLKAGEIAKGLFMNSQDTIEIKAFINIPLGHKIALIIPARSHTDGQD
ncbi:MAG: hypothetical protein C0407_17850 [Desulfobacca sp.]|nr:hypothetical protein [Desulfobacca sp.]